MRIAAGIVGILSCLGLILLYVAGALLAASANHPILPLPAGLPAEAVHFQSDSGSEIHGWLVRGRPGAGVVVLMHGVRGNRTDMLGRAQFLLREGYSSLLFDFQAHGESPGEHITFGYLESRDAQAAVAFARHRFPGAPVAAIGVSLGGAAAVLAEPPLEVDALVLELTYGNIWEAISNRIAMRLGAPGKLLTPLLALQLSPRLGISAEQLRPEENIGRIMAPILLIAGEKDAHTTLRESERLYDRIHSDKVLWVVKGARHQNIHQLDRTEYERRVLGFLRQHMD